MPIYNTPITAETIFQAAQNIGFDACGIANTKRLDEDAIYMDTWVGKGLHGDMSYLERNREKRYDIRALVPGGKTIIVCLLSYAKCGHDYHRAVKSKLYELESTISCTPLSTQHIFCDSAPVLERRWAVEAGLGFIGKNRQFFHPTLGSFVHIGELVIGEEVLPSTPTSPTELAEHRRNRCGDCRLCIEACPNQALGQEDWDARKCVAYVTHKCEVCQKICPLNQQILSLLSTKKLNIVL